MISFENACMKSSEPFDELEVDTQPYNSPDTSLVVGGPTLGTRQLLQLCQTVSPKHLAKPIADLLTTCAGLGEEVDILYHNPFYDLPILHDLIERGLPDCVQACLRVPQPLDFTRRGNVWPLWECALRCPKLSRGLASLQHLVDRIYPPQLFGRTSSASKDHVDWWETNDAGETLLENAARQCRLKEVWGVVCTVPDFGPAKQPIRLDAVYSSDWRELKLRDQQCFKPTRIF